MAISRRQHVVNDQLISLLEAVPQEKKHEETIVLLHGWGSEAKVWTGFMQFLEAEGYRVLAPDLPGFGQSEFPQEAFSVNDYVEIVRLLLFQSEVDTYVLVGHSFGGRITIKTAATQPSYLTKIILTGAAGVILPDKQRTFIQTATSIGKKIIPGWLYKKVRRKFYGAINSTEYISVPELEGTFRKVVGEDLEPYLSKINTPALLLWGSADEATTLVEGKIMNEKIAQSKLSIFEGAGHYAFLDNPPRFYQECLQFLQN